MNASAGSSSNYQVETAEVKGGKKKTTTFKPVGFQAAFNQATNTVTLTIAGNQAFTSGGKIVINASPPGGVASASGVLLDPSDTNFSIGNKANGITAE